MQISVRVRGGPLDSQLRDTPKRSIAMRLQRTDLLPAVVALVLAASYGVASTAAATRPCMDPHYRVIERFHDGLVLEYRIRGGGRTYACSFSVGKYVDLTEGGIPLRPFRITGHFVGYVSQADNSAAPYPNDLFVTNLKTGEDVRSWALEDPEGGVGSIVLRRDGHVAWIDCSPSPGDGSCSRRPAPGETLRRRVVRLGHRLDRGAAIVPSSLHSASGGRICWMHGKHRRCARFL